MAASQRLEEMERLAASIRGSAPPATARLPPSLLAVSQEGVSPAVGATRGASDSPSVAAAVETSAADGAVPVAAGAAAASGAQETPSVLRRAALPKLPAPPNATTLAAHEGTQTDLECAACDVGRISKLKTAETTETVALPATPVDRCASTSTQSARDVNRLPCVTGGPAQEKAAECETAELPVESEGKLTGHQSPAAPVLSGNRPDPLLHPSLLPITLLGPLSLARRIHRHLLFCWAHAVAAALYEALPLSTWHGFTCLNPISTSDILSLPLSWTVDDLPVDLSSSSAQSLLAAADLAATSGGRGGGRGGQHMDDPAMAAYTLALMLLRSVQGLVAEASEEAVFGRASGGKRGAQERGGGAGGKKLKAWARDKAKTKGGSEGGKEAAGYQPMLVHDAQTLQHSTQTQATGLPTQADTGNAGCGGSSAPGVPITIGGSLLQSDEKELLSEAVTQPSAEITAKEQEEEEGEKQLMSCLLQAATVLQRMASHLVQLRLAPPPVPSLSHPPSAAFPSSNTPQSSSLAQAVSFLAAGAQALPQPPKELTAAGPRSTAAQAEALSALAHVLQMPVASTADMAASSGTVGATASSLAARAPAPGSHSYSPVVTGRTPKAAARMKGLARSQALQGPLPSDIHPMSDASAPAPAPAPTAGPPAAATTDTTGAMGLPAAPSQQRGEDDGGSYLQKMWAAMTLGGEQGAGRASEGPGAAHAGPATSKPPVRKVQALGTKSDLPAQPLPALSLLLPQAPSHQAQPARSPSLSHMLQTSLQLESAGQVTTGDARMKQVDQHSMMASAPSQQVFPRVLQKRIKKVKPEGRGVHGGEMQGEGGQQPKKKRVKVATKQVLAAQATAQSETTTVPGTSNVSKHPGTDDFSQQLTMQPIEWVLALPASRTKQRQRVVRVKEAHHPERVGLEIARPSEGEVKLPTMIEEDDSIPISVAFVTRSS